MARQWYAVIDAKGRAVSFGTDVAEDLSPDLSVVHIDHQPGVGEAWDASKKMVVSVPTPTDPLRSAYASAATTDQKLDIIAQRLGLK